MFQLPRAFFYSKHTRHEAKAVDQQYIHMIQDATGQLVLSVLCITKDCRGEELYIPTSLQLKKEISCSDHAESATFILHFPSIWKVYLDINEWWEALVFQRASNYFFCFIVGVNKLWIQKDYVI